MYRLHRILGLLVLLPLLLFCISGILLGFEPLYRDHQLASQFPQLNQSVPQPWISTQLRSVDLIFKKIQENTPQSGPPFELKRIDFPATTHRPIRIQVEIPKGRPNPSSPKTLSTYWDPLSLNLLGTEEAEKSHFMNWILQLHRGSWAGAPGKVMMSLLAGLIVLMWPTGVMIRQSRLRKTRALKWKAPSKTWIHRLSGFAAGMLISWMAISGSTMNFKQDLVRFFDPEPKAISQLSPPLSGTRLEKAIDVAASLKPKQVIESIRFQQKFNSSMNKNLNSSSILLFYFSDTSRVYLDSSSLAVLKITSPTSHWVQALFPFHSGRAFGRFQLPYVLVVGSLGLMITLTGAMIRQP